MLLHKNIGDIQKIITLINKINIYFYSFSICKSDL